MNKVKSSILTAAALATIGGFVTLGATATNAQTESASRVERIAAKFNLKSEDVQKVLDEVKVERQAEMTQRMSDRLDKLVTDGKLTDEQKTLIIAKQAELKTKHEAERTALETWSSANNIDLKYLRPFRSGDLDQLVTDGKITDEQKTLIIAKQAELKTKHEAQKTELEAWAKTNNIDIKYLMQRGGHGPRGRGGMMKDSNMMNPSDSGELNAPDDGPGIDS